MCRWPNCFVFSQTSESNIYINLNINVPFIAITAVEALRAWGNGGRAIFRQPFRRKFCLGSANVPQELKKKKYSWIADIFFELLKLKKTKLSCIPYSSHSFYCDYWKKYCWGVLLCKLAVKELARDDKLVEDIFFLQFF